MTTTLANDMIFIDMARYGGATRCTTTLEPDSIRQLAVGDLVHLWGDDLEFDAEVAAVDVDANRATFVRTSGSAPTVA